MTGRIYGSFIAVTMLLSLALCSCANESDLDAAVVNQGVQQINNVHELNDDIGEQSDMLDELDEELK